MEPRHVPFITRVVRLAFLQRLFKHHCVSLQRVLLRNILMSLKIMAPILLLGPRGPLESRSGGRKAISHWSYSASSLGTPEGSARGTGSPPSARALGNRAQNSRTRELRAIPGAGAPFCTVFKRFTI